MAVFNATFFAAMTVIALPASLAIAQVGYVPVMVTMSVSSLGSRCSSPSPGPDDFAGRAGAADRLLSQRCQQPCGNLTP